MTDQEVLDLVRESYRLEWDGLHGYEHWQRVRQIGLRLCESTGANRRVVALFAWLHDSCRQDDGWDVHHGRRSAEFVRSLGAERLGLDPDEWQLLMDACAGHADGKTEADVTVQTCWDADRLDLGRLDIQPHPKYLCTAAARDPEMIRWAVSLSQPLLED